MSEESERRRLARLLRQLAAEARPHPLGRPVGHAPDLPAAFLREIDETILPRRLTFHTDTGAEITCEAYARRLLAVLSPAPGTDVTDHDALHAWLDHVLAGAQSLHVTGSTPLSGTDPARPGVEAGTLAALWGIDLDPAAAPPAGPAVSPARFREEVQRAALAWIARRTDRATARSGPPEAIAELERRAPALLTALGALPVPRCLARIRPHDVRATMAAEDAEGVLLALLVPEDAVRLAALWQRATARG